MREVGAKLEMFGSLLGLAALVAFGASRWAGEATQVAYLVGGIAAALTCLAFGLGPLLTGEQRFRGGYVVRGGPAYLGGVAFLCMALAMTIGLIGHFARADSASWLVTAAGVMLISAGFLFPSVAWGYIQNGPSEYRFYYYVTAAWLGLFALAMFGAGVLMVLVGIGLVPRELLRG